MNYPHIFYINLDYRTDRREQIENELKHTPFTFERVCGIRTEPGIIGCGQSHLRCLEIAKERELPWVWIMEDDFTFTMDMENVIHTLRQIQNHTSLIWPPLDVIMCAYYFDPDLQKMQTQVNTQKGDNLIRAKNVQTASSYIVFSHYYDTLIKNLKDGNKLLVDTGEHWHYANDQYWKWLQLKDNWVYTVPRFGIQRESYSDNSKTIMNYGV